MGKSMPVTCNIKNTYTPARSGYFVQSEMVGLASWCLQDPQPAIDSGSSLYGLRLLHYCMLRRKEIPF